MALDKENESPQDIYILERFAQRIHGAFNKMTETLGIFSKLL